MTIAELLRMIFFFQRPKKQRREELPPELNIAILSPSGERFDPRCIRAWRDWDSRHIKGDLWWGEGHPGRR